MGNKASHKTTIKQKIFLICFGLFLSLILLEALLRIGGLVLNIQKNQANRLPVDFDDTYRILTLGESTTTCELAFHCWPSQLEDMLKNGSTSLEFEVFNEGVQGATIQQIVDKTEEYISKYEPHMIVAMLGVNEYIAECSDDYRLPMNEKSRVVELSKLIYIHMNNRKTEMVIETYQSLPEISPELIQVINKSDRDNMVLFYESWGEHIDYIHNLSLEGRCHEVELLIDSFLEIEANENGVISQLLECYNRTGEFKDPEEFFTYAIDRFPQFDQVYDMLAMHYESKGEMRKAEIVSRKASHMRINCRSSVAEQYQRLFEMATDNDINLVVMQYPTLDVDEMKSYFPDKNQMTFVSNQENFRQALMDNDFYDLFLDHFAGSWGHATEFGNRLIAENVAKVVIETVED